MEKQVLFAPQIYTDRSKFRNYISPRTNSGFSEVILLVLMTGMMLFVIAFSSETQLGDTEEWSPGLYCVSELELPSSAS